jgi:hypothetical protein
MADAVLDALLPGRGATRVKYDADIVDTPQADGTSLPVVRYELVCYESLKWDRWIFGFAKKWRRVPWLAIEHDVTKQEATELFTPAIANKLTYSPAEEVDSEENAQSKRDDDTDETRNVARVYEIWDKDGGRKVRFVAPSYHDGYLKEDEDPLDLTGFFPMPEPLRFLRKSNDQMPVALYCLYENQAKELNRITTRINKIVEAIKVRGVYAGTGNEIEELLKKDDNTLVPAGDSAAVFDGSLDKMIWLMPIEKLIVVIQQLYIAREGCKRVIYEITGISDILRGSSIASETLGAQEIKEQWGTMRLKRLQREVQRYARDLLRISLEIAAKKFSVKTFATMTGLPYPTAQAQQAAQMQIAIAQQQGLPPPPDALKVMAQPPWEAVLETLRNDTQRQYRIDIETNSTVDLEATEDQKHIAEVMNAIAQFLNGVAPLIESGTMPFQAAQAMLLGIVRRYRFGTEVEDQIKAMQPPKPQDDGKDAKAALDGEKAKIELERTAMAEEKKLLAKEHNLELRELKLELDRQLFQIEQKAAAEQQKVVEARNDLKLQEHMHEVENTVERAGTQLEGKVKSITDSAVKKGEQSRAGDVQQSKQLSTTVQQLVGMQKELLTALAKQSGETKEAVGVLAEALMAEKELVRGPDGRASGIRAKKSA